MTQDAPQFEFEYQEPQQDVMDREGIDIMNQPQAFHNNEEPIEPRLFTQGQVEPQDPFLGDEEITDLDIRTVALNAVIEHQRISPGIVYPSIVMAADAVAAWLKDGTVLPEARAAMLGAPEAPSGGPDPDVN